MSLYSNQLSKLGWDFRRPSVVIWDLDGTLRDGKHRLHLLPKKEDAHRCDAWDEFNMAAVNDSPILDNIELLKATTRRFRVIILTGAGEVSRTITERWLWENGVPYDCLIMRARDDHRVDTAFKQEVLNLITGKLVGGRIVACFDDAEHIVKHIRCMGITCHQVTHYDNPTLDKQEGNGHE